MTSLNNFKIFEHKSTQTIGETISLNPELISKKTSTSKLSNAMFEYLGISINELKKQNVIVKTVRLQENLKPKESMSFEKINFQEVVQEQWSSSFLKKKFSISTFIFVVFQDFQGSLYFRGLYSWKMPNHIVENDLQQFWQHLHTKLKQGVTLTPVTQGSKIITKNDLPCSSDSKIMHVRPKAKDANDVTPLPDGQMITKQAYWINASYIGEILSDMPPLQINKETEPEKQTYTYSSFKHLLTEEIYTIDQVIEIAQEVNNEFDQFQINEQALYSVGYKLSPPYAVSTVYENANDYLLQTILKDRYFEVPENQIWQTSFVTRTLQNLENNFSIFKIDNTTYLTENALESANISKQTIQDYKTSIENFVLPNQFFTLASLRNDGFIHPIEDFGFDSLFYESILKRPGHLQYLKFCNHHIFIKSYKKPTSDQFLNSFFTNRKQLELDQLQEYLALDFGLNLTFSELEQTLKSTDFKKLFYSPELTILFKNKESFLDYIY